MSEQYLNRGDAPFGDSVWQQIDQTVVAAAKGVLNGRRLLHTRDTQALGLKVLPLSDTKTDGKALEGVTVSSSCLIPVAMIHSEFALSVRDVAAYESAFGGGVPLDLTAAMQAAVALARQEDRIVFNGFAPLNLVGLLNTPGTRSVKLRPWDQVGDAVQDILGGVSQLDAAGFSGPYSLALTSKSYNHLFRLYPNSELTELEHVRQIAADGVIKASAIPGGGVLVDTSGPFATIVLGQDLKTSFVGPAPGQYQFSILESVALWVQVPEAVCVLK